MRIGITGENGFIGTHLRRYITGAGGGLEHIPFDRSFFNDHRQLVSFAAGCDVIVHLAGLSRDPDGGRILRVNRELTAALIRACREVPHPPRILFASTTHEAKDAPYHESKRLCRRDLEEWAASCSNASCTTMLMPNTFGPGGKPFFNSVVPTFCHLAARGMVPEEIGRVELQLIHISTLCREIIALAQEPMVPGSSCRAFSHEYTVPLPELWERLQKWYSTLLQGGEPEICGAFEADLWGTFRSHL